MTCGKAKTVLVFGQGDAAQAVVSTIAVRRRPLKSGRRLVVAGPVTFDPAAMRHIHETVLIALDRILELLDVPRCNFEVSVANINATALRDLGLEVSGFSADGALFLAMLSAALGLPLVQDLLVSVSIGSADGDIRLVSQLPAKLQAVLRDHRIRRVIIPALDADGSTDTLTPIEHERIVLAMTAAKASLPVLAVRDVAELLRANPARAGRPHLLQPDALCPPHARRRQWLSARNLLPSGRPSQVSRNTPGPGLGHAQGMRRKESAHRRKSHHRGRGRIPNPRCLSQELPQLRLRRPHDPRLLRSILSSPARGGRSGGRVCWTPERPRPDQSGAETIMKPGEQMLLFHVDDCPGTADSTNQQGRGPSAETATPSDVPVDRCTGPLFCPRCGTPYDWASAAEFCTCGARRCVSCGDG